MPAIAAQPADQRPGTDAAAMCRLVALLAAEAPRSVRAERIQDVLAVSPSAYLWLPVHAATNDHRLGICIWEGAAVEAVSDAVEGLVGAFADNEYYEMRVDGLVPQLASS
jgi:hypothetical protein